MLVINEISMTSGKTFYTVNCSLNAIAGIAETDQRVFGGIPIVLLTGDFAQFAPINQTSLLLPHSSAGAQATSNQIVNNLQSQATEASDVEASKVKAHTPRKRRRIAVDAATAHDNGHRLFQRFNNVILLNKQMQARSNNELIDVLQQLHDGRQNEQSFHRMKRQELKAGESIDWISGTRAITPNNASRARLNMNAILSFTKKRGQNVRIFISTHVWGSPDPNQRAPTLAQTDCSKVHVPSLFFYTNNMPVVTTKNSMPSLKLINRTEFSAAGIVPAKEYPGITIAKGVFLHFGPPAAILLRSESSRDVQVPGLPKGVLMLAPESVTMTCQTFRFLKQSCIRRGLACVPAFALTDYKAQGRSFDKIFVYICGRRKPEDQADPLGMYVALSRCRTLAGICIAGTLRYKDWIGKIPQGLQNGLHTLQRMSEATISRWMNGDGIEAQIASVSAF